MFEWIHIEASWNVITHAQKPYFVFRRNGRIYLNLWGRGRHSVDYWQPRCAPSAVLMLDTPRSELVWRVLAIHSIRQFPLHFTSRASPCAITFQLESTVYYFIYPSSLHVFTKTESYNVNWSPFDHTDEGAVMNTSGASCENFSAVVVLFMSCDTWHCAAKTTADVAKHCGAFEARVKHNKNCVWDWVTLKMRASEVGRPYERTVALWPLMAHKFDGKMKFKKGLNLTSKPIYLTSVYKYTMLYHSDTTKLY